MLFNNEHLKYSFFRIAVANVALNCQKARNCKFLLTIPCVCKEICVPLRPHFVSLPFLRVYLRVV